MISINLTGAVYISQFLVSCFTGRRLLFKTSSKINPFAVLLYPYYYIPLSGIEPYVSLFKQFDCGQVL